VLRIKFLEKANEHLTKYLLELQQFFWAAQVSSDDSNQTVGWKLYFLDILATSHCCSKKIRISSVYFSPRLAVYWGDNGLED
jgi:hypothetical protein